MHLQESKQFDGQVLVAREAERNQTGGASHVVDTYEPVAGTHTVMNQSYCREEFSSCCTDNTCICIELS